MLTGSSNRQKSIIFIQAYEQGLMYLYDMVMGHHFVQSNQLIESLVSYKHTHTHTVCSNL